jgi:hypothetical protein
MLGYCHPSLSGLYSLLKNGLCIRAQLKPCPEKKQTQMAGQKAIG